MEPMLKVVEVAELMGCSSQYIRRMAKDGKIQGQKQDNGGNTLEWVFPVSALAEPYQQRYFDQQKQPSAVALAQKLSGDGTPPKKPLDYYTAEEREAIAFWMRLVSDWLDYRKKPGANKAKVDEQFVLLCKLEHPELQISIDTLYRRWKAIKEKDYDGLIDKRGKWKKGKSTIEDTAIAKDRAVSWPAGVSTAAGGGTGCKAGFYVGVATSGVRAAWCCYNLNNGGLAGLPARNSNNTVTNSNWNGCAGSPCL